MHGQYRIFRKKYHFVKKGGVWTLFAPTKIKDCNKYTDEKRRAVLSFFRTLNGV